MRVVPVKDLPLGVGDMRCALGGIQYTVSAVTPAGPQTGYYNIAVTLNSTYQQMGKGWRDMSTEQFNARVGEFSTCFGESILTKITPEPREYDFVLRTEKRYGAEVEIPRLRPEICTLKFTITVMGAKRQPRRPSRSKSSNTTRSDAETWIGVIPPINMQCIQYEEEIAEPSRTANSDAHTGGPEKGDASRGSLESDDSELSHSRNQHIVIQMRRRRRRLVRSPLNRLVRAIEEAERSS